MDNFNFSTQEEIILLIIAYMYPAAYGYSIKKELASKHNIHLALGTIHTILYRLDRRGYLQSYMGGSSELRGGRSKRLYMLSPYGKEILMAIKATREEIYEKVELENLELKHSK